MATESISNCCPKCQAPLPADAPQGLCPKCLLAAVATPTEAGQPAGRPSPPPLEVIAAAFPQLEILEFIGQGGMGFVFKARQPKLDRLVALKILPQSLAADPTFAERFNREARLLARLNHPGIVTVHDFGVAVAAGILPAVEPGILPGGKRVESSVGSESLEAIARSTASPGGRMPPSTSGKMPDATSPTPHSALRVPRFYYLLMEFVDGVNLRQAMQAGRFTPEQALAIVPKICEALQFAHNEGILHRDIKPENILLDAKGRVKIADFGIAKLVGTEQPLTSSLSPSDGERLADRPGEGFPQPALTEAGRSLGTPNYMAPEQLENAGEVDHRADIYSLGVVFYEMLTGELPLGRFAPPSQRSAADPRVDEVVLRALEKEKARRYASADEVKTRVETIAATTDSARSQTSETQKSDKPVKAMQCWFSTTQYMQSFIGGFYPKQGDCELMLFGDRLLLVTAFDRSEIPLSAIHTVRRLRGPVYQNPFLEHCLHLQYDDGGWRKDLVIVPGRKVYYLTGWQEPEVVDWCIAIREAVAANTGRMPDGSISSPAILHPSPLGTLVVYGVALITVLLSALLSKLPILMVVFPIAFGLTIGAMLLWGLLNQPSLPVGVSSEGSRTRGAPVARRRKEAVTITLLGLLLVATLSVLVLNLQAPRIVDTAAVVASPTDTPGGQLTASGVTIGKMRIFGSDEYEYRFTIQDSAGVVVRQTELPVPFDNDKLRPDFSIVGGPLPEYYFGTHGRIEWKPDGSAAVFSMRGVELTQLQVDRFSGPARPPTFVPVVERVEANAAKALMTGWVPEGARIALELGKGQGWLGGCDFTNATRFTASLERHADAARCVIRDAASNVLFDLTVQVTIGQRVLAQGKFVFDTRRETINAKGPIRLGEWRSESGEVLPVSVVLQAASEKLVRAPIPPRPTFGPVIERVVNDIGERQGSEALQLVSGQLLSLPAPARELNARSTWMVANQADVLLDFTANHRLTLAAGIKLADYQAANWETATPVELAKALQTEATGLGHVAGSGAQEYWLTEQPKFPVTLAFQVAGGQRGLLQITGFTENPRGVKIRYKLVQASATNTTLTATQPVWGEPTNGVVASLRVGKTVWQPGETPVLRASITNGSGLILNLSRADHHRHQVELDGKWYRSRINYFEVASPSGAPFYVSDGGALVEIKPGEQWNDVQIPLKGREWQKASARDLDLTAYFSGFVVLSNEVAPVLPISPGKHTVRLAFIAEPARAIYGKPVFRVISNPVEIEIAKPTEPAEPRTDLQLYSTVEKHPGKARIMAELKKESLDQSLDRLLADDEQYFVFISGVKGGQNNLEQMLAARRSVKVLQEIQALTPGDRETKCRLLFSKAFQMHTNACRTAQRHATDAEAPRNTQSMLTTQIGLSAALFITAEVGRLDLLEDQFAQLDRWRSEIEPLASLPDLRFPAERQIPALSARYISPDCRLQVNALRLAALRAGPTGRLQQVDEQCVRAGMKLSEMPIVPWDAETTRFEILPDSPLDTSKGVTYYQFYDWSSDSRGRLLTGDKAEEEAQQNLVRKLQSIVFRVRVSDSQSATPKQGEAPLLPSGMSISAAGGKVVVETPNGTLTADRIEFPGTNLLKATNMRMTVNSNSPPLR